MFQLVWDVRWLCRAPSQGITPSHISYENCNILYNERSRGGSRRIKQMLWCIYIYTQRCLPLLEKSRHFEYGIQNQYQYVVHLIVRSNTSTIISKRTVSVWLADGRDWLTIGWPELVPNAEWNVSLPCPPLYSGCDVALIQFLPSFLIGRIALTCSLFRSCSSFHTHLRCPALETCKVPFWNA